MWLVGFEPTKPKHEFTIHRNNHSATTNLFSTGVEPVTFDLEGHCSTN